MDSIQFGAPSSTGSTDSDGAPAPLETAAENKLPAPKEQRQKQPRAGPIKTQKVWEGTWGWSAAVVIKGDMRFKCTMIHLLIINCWRGGSILFIRSSI